MSDWSDATVEVMEYVVVTFAPAGIHGPVAVTHARARLAAMVDADDAIPTGDVSVEVFAGPEARAYMARAATRLGRKAGVDLDMTGRVIIVASVKVVDPFTVDAGLVDAERYANTGGAW